MHEYIKVKSITRKQDEETFSIENREEKQLDNNPNFLVGKGFISKNSKHACVHKDSLVLTQRGKVPIHKLEENDKIAYVNTNGEIRLTKKFDLVNTGKKKLFRVKLKSGKEIIITKDHELFSNFNGVIESTKLAHLEVGSEIIIF